LIVVDLRAAEARILFESLREGKRESQALIWPLEVPADPEEDLEGLNRIGVECRLVKKTLWVEALPPFLHAADFSLFLNEWRAGKNQLEQIAARFSKKVRKAYSIDEGISLWKKLQTCRDGIYDPLGNPIYRKMGEEDLSEWLKHG
jgi:hypothetical protein